MSQSMPSTSSSRPKNSPHPLVEFPSSLEPSVGILHHSRGISIVCRCSRMVAGAANTRRRGNKICLPICFDVRKMTKKRFPASNRDLL
jgi:hypothetical protein